MDEDRFLAVHMDGVYDRHLGDITGYSMDLTEYIQNKDKENIEYAKQRLRTVLDEMYNDIISTCEEASKEA